MHSVIRQHRHEQVRPDALRLAVPHRAQARLALQAAERGFDLRQPPVRACDRLQVPVRAAAAHLLGPRARIPLQALGVQPPGDGCRVPRLAPLAGRGALDRDVVVRRHQFATLVEAPYALEDLVHALGAVLARHARAQAGQLLLLTLALAVADRVLLLLALLAPDAELDLGGIRLRDLPGARLQAAAREELQVRVALRLAALAAAHRDPVAALLLQPGEIGLGGDADYFNRYYFAQQHKEGAVVDERFSGGGSAADCIIDIMSRDLIGFFNSPVAKRKPFTLPGAGIWGPKVMIINEAAGSGGDLLPYMFRFRGIGPLVGTTTWGGSASGTCRR